MLKSSQGDAGAQAFCLHSLSLPAGDIHEVLLPLGGPGNACTIRLRCIPGASCLHLVFLRDGVVNLRAEIAAENGEVLAVEVEVSEDGDLLVRSRGQDVFTLPPDEIYAPLPSLRPVALDEGLDLALVIDGTVRRFRTGEGEERRIVADLLLDRKEVWREQVDLLARFVEILAEGARDPRTAVIAFGDKAPRGAVAPDLNPRYHLYPPEEERSFLEFSAVRLRANLEAIPPTPGGDFVDALADALHACRKLRWRNSARKILMVVGDSPGYSILHPFRKGADMNARERDVDSEALALHREGVEIVTVYNSPPAAELGWGDLEYQKDLLGGARAQYLRLASLPAYAFEDSSFEPESAAAAVCRRKGLLARGASLAEVVDVIAR
jgi:hypothetical protein